MVAVLALLVSSCRHAGEPDPKVEPPRGVAPAAGPTPDLGLRYHPLEASLSVRPLRRSAGDDWYSPSYAAGLARAVSIAEDMPIETSHWFVARTVPNYLGARIDPQMKADFTRFDAKPSRKEWSTSIALTVSNSEAKYSELCGGQDVSAVFNAVTVASPYPPYALYDACGFGSMKFYPRSYQERSTSGFEVVAVLLLHDLASRGGLLPLEWKLLRMMVGEPEITRASYRDQRDFLEGKGWLRDVPVAAAADFLAPASFSRVTYPSAGTELAAWLAAPAGGGCERSVILLHGGPFLTAEDFEIAIPFLDAGWTVMLPTYRGENGNRGSAPFLLGAVDDVESASTWLAERNGDPQGIHVFGFGLGSLVADILTLHPGAVVESSASVDGLWFESDFGVFDPESWLFDPLDAAHVAPRRLFGHVDEMTTRHYVFITGAHSDPAGALAYARGSGPRNGFMAPEQLVAEPLSGLGADAIDIAARWFIRCAADVADCPEWAL